MIVNIQRYSIHDGDGIRSTVFFKGCPLACRWCHNPETQSPKRQLMVYAERCTGCGACIPACPDLCIRPDSDGAETVFSCCTACGACEAACRYGARELVGEALSAQELAERLLRDQIFFENSGGGVTLSGGEPLAQDMDYIEALLRRLKRRGVDVAVDTCGDVPWASFERVLPYADTFLYDMKSFDDALHRAYTGRGNHRILDNLLRLGGSGARIYLRVPVIEGFNAHDAEMDAMIGFAAEHLRLAQVNLLPYHKTGRDKWARLGRAQEEDDLASPSDERMEALAERWRGAGLSPVKIGG